MNGPLEPDFHTITTKCAQIQKLEPTLQKYRTQDQQILDLIVHVAEEKDQEKQAAATRNADVDVVQVISTSIAPNV